MTSFFNIFLPPEFSEHFFKHQTINNHQTKWNKKFSNVCYIGKTQDFILFQILVHSPYEYPEVSAKGASIGVSKEVFIGVMAHYTEWYIHVFIVLTVHHIECKIF